MVIIQANYLANQVLYGIILCVRYLHNRDDESR